MVSVNPIEALWIGTTLLTLVLTVAALREALRDRVAVRALNGHARELAVQGNVRRARFAVLIQLLLLFIALPGLFSDREASINPIVLALMAVPVLLCVETIWDLAERRTLIRVLAKEVRR